MSRARLTMPATGAAPLSSCRWILPAVSTLPCAISSRQSSPRRYPSSRMWHPAARAPRAPEPTFFTRVTSPRWPRRPTWVRRLRYRSAASRVRRRQRPRRPRRLPATTKSRRAPKRIPPARPMNEKRSMMPSRISANDAREQGVIEIVAKDVPDLLRQLQGRKVKAADHEWALDTNGIQVRSVAPDWRTRMLLILTHPTIAYGLLLIGIYGLLLEGYNPGAVLPGVVGALSLLLGLYGLQLLAVNYAGLALMALGIGLIITEFFMPAFGSLGVGGLAAFVIGSIMLFDNQASGMGMAMPLIAGIAIAAGVIMAAIGWLGARARRRPPSTGVETMIGATVEAVSDCQDRCVVRFGGELWNARTPSPLRAGQQARIVKVVDLTLWVEPQQK